MPDSSERLVNLALLLASCPRPLTAEQCRSAGMGYPADQDDAAFIRMFERDKDALRASGLVIDVTDDGETEAYRLNAEATYARPVELAADEVAAIRAVAAALAGDVDFPFRQDLAFALGKLGAVGVERSFATTELTEDDGSAGRGLDARALAEAVQTRKTVTFGYTNAAGETRRRTIDPYGVFFREGVWYVTGRDQDADAIKTFAVSRVRDLDVNPSRPRTPDFDRPEDFHVREHEFLPFQIGMASATAQIRFEPDVAWRARGLARSRGSLDDLPDGSVVWTVPVADLARLASWLVTEGPGLLPVEPPELLEVLSDGLRAVVSAHE
ncbi:MAG: WYL domain-containing protein [Coriobacteriia bacterium]